MNITREDEAELQKAIVFMVAQATPSPWVRIIASYEVEDRPDGREQNLIVMYVHRERQTSDADSLEQAPTTIHKAFDALHETSGSAAEDRWKASS